MTGYDIVSATIESIYPLAFIRENITFTTAAYVYEMIGNLLHDEK